jgi:AcrR family transcriptional regulator
LVRKPNSRSKSSKTKPFRAARRDARRDGILHAAAALFRTNGFADTGMREIAAAAGLSPANLYHYFRGKDELLFYCQDRTLDRMLANITRVRNQRMPVPERLRMVLTDHLHVMLDEVEGATAHLQTDALSPAWRSRIVKKRDRYEHALRALIANGVARRECIAADPAMAARAMLGALNWTVTWFNPDGPQSADEVSRQMAEYLVRGVES